MKRALCAIALATLVLGVNPAHSEQTRAVDLPHIKAALRITPAQEPYWAPVEAVLRDIARRHEEQQVQASNGTMQRMRQRAVVIVLDSVAVARLAQAARPLARVLTDEQKRAAQELARKMGLTHMLAELC
jgi:hypothetical protein